MNANALIGLHQPKTVELVPENGLLRFLLSKKLIIVLNESFFQPCLHLMLCSLMMKPHLKTKSAQYDELPSQYTSADYSIG